jgi:hypothetical protein
MFSETLVSTYEFKRRHYPEAQYRQLCTLLTGSVYGFRIIFRIKSDYFTEQR